MSKLRVSILVLLCSLFLRSNLLAKDPFVPPWVEETAGRREEAKTVHRRNVTLTPGAKRETWASRREPKISFDEESRVSVRKMERVKPLLQVDGIVWSDSRGGTFISGTAIYKVGDRIGDACKVEEITRHKVAVKCGEDLWEYSVEGGASDEVY